MCTHLYEPPLPLSAPDFLSEPGFCAGLGTQPWAGRSSAFGRNGQGGLPEEVTTADAAPLMGWVSAVVSALDADTGKLLVKTRKGKRCEGRH